MRAILLVGLLLVASAAAGTVPLVQPASVLGYHEAVGIPEAARIKAFEDQYFAALGEAGHILVNPHIVGGAVAGSNAHPYLGGLIIDFVNIAGQSACGSSLLSSNRLVTAGHCWYDGNNQASQFTVVLGSHWLFSGGTRITTDQVITHSGWSPPTRANDVAVIYLPYNVPLSAAIQPVALPLTTQLGEQFLGQWAVATGYGRTSDQQTSVSTSTVVSEVSLQVITVAQCQATYGSAVVASNICTSGAGGVGICGGDSGGPLVINNNGQNALVGISSFVASEGCEMGNPSAFTRITSFYSFIVSHL